MAKDTVEVLKEVIAKGGIWNAFDQGRLAYHIGLTLADNPKALDSRANMTDWNRGWLKEQMERTFKHHGTDKSPTACA